VTSATGLGDVVGHLVNLSLGATEGTKSSLCELAGTLVLGVTEKFNNATLVGSETSNLLDNVTDESGALAEVTLGAGNTDCGLAGGDLL